MVLQNNFEQTPRKSLNDFWTLKSEQVYLFYFVDSFEKATKYNLGGNIWLQLWGVCSIWS